MTQNVLLGDLVEVVRGISYRSADYAKQGEGLPFVNLKCVGRGGGFRQDGIKYYKGDFRPEQNVQPGDILIANTDLTQNREVIGSPIIMPDIGDEACFSLDLSKLVVKDDNKVDQQYLYYFLKSPAARSYMLASSNGSTVMHLSVKSVPKMSLDLPDIATQKKIADILGSLDEKIELNCQMSHKLEQMGQALFRHYFIDNPEAEGWQEKSLDEIASYLNGLAMQKYPKIDGEPTLPVIKIREMSSGITAKTDIASANIPEKYIINNGDLLFSWSGTLLLKFWSGGEGALNQHLFKVDSVNYPEWLYYHWTKHHLDEFIQIAKSKATTMGHIQRRHLNQAKVRVPNVGLLDEIGNKMEPLIEQRKENNQQIQTLTTLRDTLLPKLISGEVKV